jgi:hypothetical protein
MRVANPKRNDASQTYQIEPPLTEHGHSPPESRLSGKGRGYDAIAGAKAIDDESGAVTDCTLVTSMAKLLEAEYLLASWPLSNDLESRF